VSVVFVGVLNWCVLACHVYSARLYEDNKIAGPSVPPPTKATFTRDAGVRRRSLDANLQQSSVTLSTPGQGPASRGVTDDEAVHARHARENDGIYVMAADTEGACDVDKRGRVKQLRSGLGPPYASDGHSLRVSTRLNGSKTIADSVVSTPIAVSTPKRPSARELTCLCCAVCDSFHPCARGACFIVYPSARH
jgi:hypothetical protein